MSEYESMIKRQRKWMLYLLAIFVLGAILSSNPIFFNGLLLGGTISYYNLWNLQRKINRFGESAVAGRPVRGIGTLTRMISAGLAVIIALRFETHFHLIGVIIGLVISYMVIMIDFGIRTFSRNI